MVYITMILILFSFISLCDTTLLWRINLNPPAYILGTTHLPQTYLWPSLSDTAKTAFNTSTHFLPEFDMTNFFSFSRLRLCVNSIKSPNGNGAPPLGPSQPYDHDNPILDVYLTLEARRLGKSVTSLESVEMYCEFAKFQADSFKSNSTASPQTTDYNHIKQIYDCDLNFPGESLPPMPDHIGDPTLFLFQKRLEEVVGRRDTKMSQAIDDLLKERSPTNRYFFAIGYLHLMSANGIITKLKRDYHYSVTRLCTDPPNFRAGLGCQAPSWCDLIAGL